MTLYRAYAALVVGLGASTALQASDNDIFDLSLQQLSSLTITTATRRSESLLSAPSSVTVLGREQIRLLGVNDLSALINYVPGFQSQRVDQGSLTHSFSSRGTRSGSASREILVLMDGQRVNNIWSGGANSSMSYFSLDNVDRVEFIRGPGSAIYGSNAFLGVINIITDTRSELAVSAGSHQQRSVSAQASETWGELELRAYVKTLEDEGESLLIYDPATMQSVSSRDPFRHREAYINGSWGNWQVNAQFSKQKMERFYVGGFVSEEANQLEMENQFINLKYKHSINQQWEVNSDVFFAERQFEVAGEIVPDPFKTFISGIVKEKEIGTDIRVNYEKSNGDNGLLGFEIRQPQLVDTDAFASGFINEYLPQAPTDKETIRGLYGQYQMHVSSDWRLVLGGRLDDYSSFGSNFSPRGGVIWNYSPQKSLKLLYGESFRAPTRAETDVQNSVAITANPNLEPEVAKTYELIWMHVDDSTQLTTTLFDTVITDAISQTQTIPISWENSERETIAGLEVEWQQQWGAGWKTRLAGSYFFDEASDVNSESDKLLTASIIYQAMNWSAALSSNYQSAKRDANSSPRGYKELSSRNLLRLHVAFDVSRSTQAYLTVENLLDKDYLATAERSQNTVGVPQRGRQATLGLRWDYGD